LSRDPSDDDDDDDGAESPVEEPSEFWLKLRLRIVDHACLHDIEGTPFYNFQGYECLSSIEGGMGLVIIARDPKLDRKVAIKLWKSTGPAAEAALLSEAKTLARLSHPNVVTVYHVGKCADDSLCEDSVYMVMEYVEGTDGREWLRTYPTWQAIRDVFVDAAMGLAAAHDAGIQHRDFKPPNMLVGKDGRTRVADFGVADMLREFADEDDEPREGVPGTPDYIAPERLRGERGDARSDQFSFCVSLWRALHGLQPYGGETVFQIVDAIESGTSLRSGTLDVPLWLTRVVLEGLARDPDDRYADMHELVRALQGELPDDDDAVDEDAAEDDAEPDVRVLHAPTGPTPADERVRLAMLTSIVAVVAVTFISALVVLRSPATSPTPSPVEPPKPAPLEESTTDSQQGVTPEQVIKLVKAGKLAEAEEMWLPEYERRQRLGVAVYEEMIRIGEACLELAHEHKEAGRIEEAKDAANAARTYGTLATHDFRRYGAHTDSEVDPGADLKQQARDFFIRASDRSR
jgi:serine/threonine protein kinase